MGETQTLAQELVYFSFCRIGMLMANAGACDVTGQLVQIQSDGQTLFTGHLAISLDLFLQRNLGRHESTVTDPRPRGQFNCRRGSVLIWNSVCRNWRRRSY